MNEESGVAYHITLRYGVSAKAALYELERAAREQPRYLRNGGDFIGLTMPVLEDLGE